MDAAPLPVALYGAVLIGAACAYYVLVRTLLAHHGRDSALATAVARDFKGKSSIVIYAAALALAYVNTWISCALYVVVTIMWLVPDPRIERTLTSP